MSNDRNYPFSRGSIFAISDKIDSFLRESNAIEREYSDEALDASLVAWNYAVDNKWSTELRKEREQYQRIVRYGLTVISLHYLKKYSHEVPQQAPVQVLLRAYYA